jgi:hypothetical protein
MSYNRDTPLLSPKNEEHKSSDLDLIWAGVDVDFKPSDLKSNSVCL